MAQTIPPASGLRATAEPTLLITRPRRQAERFRHAALRRLGAGLATVVSPILEIRPRQVGLDFAGVGGLVLTSQNAVAALAGCAPAGLPAWCVGPQTTAAASGAGLSAEQVGRDADELVARLHAHPPPLPLLHPRGAHLRGDLAARLTAAGLRTRAVVVYDQYPRPLSEPARRCLTGSAPVLLPLFSPRSAGLVAAEARTATAPLHVAAMSEAIAAAWTCPRPAARIVAAAPDTEAMLNAIGALMTALPAS